MQQISAKRVKNLTRLGGENNLQGIVQEIRISSHEQRAHTQFGIRPG